jgi:hypothetical protein
VSATEDGEAINYTWSAQGDGLTGTLDVCIAAVCKDYPVPASGVYSGSVTDQYSYSQTETITAQLTDTAGRSTGTASASATTAAAPAPTVTVALGNLVTATSGGCSTVSCYDFHVTADLFDAGTALTYTCADAEGVYFTGTVQNGGVGSGGSADVSFYTQCAQSLNGSTVTVVITDGTHKASGSYTS